METTTELIVYPNPVRSLQNELITSLSGLSTDVAIRGGGEKDFKVRSLMVSYEVAMKFDIALQCPKVFQLTNTSEGKRLLVMELCVLIRVFQESLGFSPERCMDSVFIFSTAQLLLAKYTHESFEDFVLMFKRCKMHGKNFYAKFSQQDVFDIANEYFEQKAIYLESKQVSVTDFERGRNNGYVNPLSAEIAKRLAPEPEVDEEKISTKLAREKVRQQLATYNEQLQQLSEYAQFQTEA